MFEKNGHKNVDTIKICLIVDESTDLKMINFFHPVNKVIQGKKSIIPFRLQYPSLSQKQT